MELAHSTPEAGHVGKTRTIAKLRDRFFWPTLNRDATNFVKTCKVCQLNQGQPRIATPHLRSIEPSDVFFHIAMDLVGPVRKNREGESMILVVVDFCTRFAVTVGLKTTTSEDIVNALIKEVFLKFGVAAVVTSDRGTQFHSKFTREFLACLETKQIFTTSYHPQGNGCCERLNRTIVRLLSKFLNAGQDDWGYYLPYVTFAYNTTRQESLGYSPYLLVYGREPALSLDNIVRQIARA